MRRDKLANMRKTAENVMKRNRAQCSRVVSRFFSGKHCVSSIENCTRVRDRQFCTKTANLAAKLQSKVEAKLLHRLLIDDSLTFQVGRCAFFSTRWPAARQEHDNPKAERE